MSSIIRSIAITILVSTGLAFSFKSIFGFWETFTLTTIIQYFIAFAITTYEARAGQVAMLTEALDEILERQSVVVDCPCGKGKTSVTVFIDEDTVTQCSICKNKFRVTTETSTRLLTDPLEVEKMYNKLNEVNKVNEL